MALTATYESRTHYLRTTLRGTFSLLDAQDAFDQSAQAALAAGHSRILIDASAVSGVPTQDERYLLGVFVAVNQRLHQTQDPMQVAVYGHAPLVDPNRFGETVALNRGARVKVSEQIEEALAWLGVSPSH